MKCPLCKEEMDIPILVPASAITGTKQAWQFQFLICRGCAIKREVYCQEHNCPHAGFGDNRSTACLGCVEEDVYFRLRDAPDIYRRIKNALSPDELQKLHERIKNIGGHMNNSNAVLVLRFIATTARCCGRSIDDIVARVIKEKTVDAVFEPIPIKPS